MNRINIFILNNDLRFFFNNIGFSSIFDWKELELYISSFNTKFNNLDPRKVTKIHYI